MQFIVKYARLGRDAGEDIRSYVTIIKNGSWTAATQAAMFEARQGERIVSISEGGYHGT